MKPSARIFTTRLRVRYAETDQMGVVYHANYLVWFEVGRVELLRALGLTYRQMEAEGCAMPVVELSCRYRAPARYDEELELETRLVAMRGPLVKFAYRLCRIEPGTPGPDSREPHRRQPEPGDGRGGTLLAEAMTTHLVVDRAMTKRALPEAYRAAMLAILG